MGVDQAGHHDRARGIDALAVPALAGVGADGDNPAVLDDDVRAGPSRAASVAADHPAVLQDQILSHFGSFRVAHGTRSGVAGRRRRAASALPVPMAPNGPASSAARDQREARAPAKTRI